MAVKKTTKSSTKKAATKKAAPKKKSATKKASPKSSAKKSAPKKSAPKKSAPKLTENQSKLLKMIIEAKDAGYLGDKKAEATAIKALQTKKLIKRGAKDKSGSFRYMVSKAGAKFVPGPA